MPAFARKGQSSAQNRLIMSVHYEIHDAHDLELRVHFALSSNKFINYRDIEFEVIGREVTLTGKVRSYYQKQMIQESLRQVEGVKRIKNELAVIQ